MQIIFGTHTFEALAYPRENNDMLVLNFDATGTTFEDLKAILHDHKCTRVVRFVDEGEHEIEYSNYSVYRELQYTDGEDERTIAMATLVQEDLATKVDRLAELINEQAVSIEDTNTAIDEIMTIVIPELLGGETPVDDEA